MGADLPARHCRPGGYIEIQEVTTSIRSDHYAITEDDCINQWCKLMNQGIRVMGRRLDPDFEELADMMLDVGFDDLMVIPYKLPIGAWPEPAVLKEAGAIQLIAMMEGIESLSLAVFTRCLQWSQEQVAELLAKVNKEFTKKKACYYWPG